MKRGRTVRVGAVQFSSEPFNLTNTNSFKASGTYVMLSSQRSGTGNAEEGGSDGILENDWSIWALGWYVGRATAAPLNDPRLPPFLPLPIAGLANSKALGIAVGADGKLALATKAKKGLNKPSKLAHKTLLNKAPRCVRACLPCLPACPFTKKTKHDAPPPPRRHSSHHLPPNKPNPSNSTSAKSIAVFTDKSGYRPDLKKAALARMSALKRYTQVKAGVAKPIAVKKGRGSKA